MRCFQSTAVLLGLGATALALTVPMLFAQSGDIASETASVQTLGLSILKLLVALAGMGFVGLLIWGGLTLTTNRPKGLAMIGGGLVGALLAGLAFALVNTLTGGNASLSMLVLPAVQPFWAS